MKKILNWTFGACFRTLGRFLAIFIVFALLLFVGSKLDIELPSWLSLNVSAAEININASYNSSGHFYSNGNLFDNSWYYKDFISTNSNTRQEFKLDFQSPININNADYIEFTIFTSEPSQSEIQSSDLTGICSEYSGSIVGYDDDNNPVYDYSCINYEDYYTGDRVSVISNDYKLNNFNIYVITIDNQYLSCTLTSSGKVQCPTNRKNLSSIVVHFIFKTNYISSMRFAVNIDYNLYNDVNNSVSNKLDDVNQSIQDTNDTLNNDDTTGAQDSVGGFFDDFQSEDFGLSSIVTAPLRGINAMLNDTCIAPSATYKGQTFSLPCGSMLWSRPGGEDFKSFINVMYGGFLAYLVIRKFFLDVEDLKNPNSDKVEVDKL